MAFLKIQDLQSNGIGPINLELNKGECLCLSGPSGAGKSLLLRAIADMDLNQGEVTLEDKPRITFSPSQWRQYIGLLTAESQWWHEQVGDHFPKPDLETLQALGFGPDVLQWKIARCSTGERQRLALARLLANQPQILLLDEPTASLDPESVTRVEKLISQLRQQQQISVLWVSHDPEQIKRVSDRQLIIQAGKLQVAA
ncbi:MAG: ATP-binding cassette domain-containing protein [Gammaproteobacteria bacterium]|nr:ATP-binding cassette domain-containing protein [Gammaproteobacteria bacterium]